MKVTIITAVFNARDLLTRTLDSIAAQTHSDIEHIIIDGGSTDGSLVALRTAAARGATLVSEPDRGVYDAFNKGLTRARGDVVGFLNAGDVYTSSDAVARLAEPFAASTVEAVFADVLIVDPREQKRVIRRYSSRRFTPGRMTFGIMPAHPTLFVRRTVYEVVGGYDARFRIAGDFEMCLRLFVSRNTRYVYIPEALVRMPTGGLSNRGWRSKLEITREMKRACMQAGLSTNWLKLCARFPWKMSEMFG